MRFGVVFAYSALALFGQAPERQELQPQPQFDQFQVPTPLAARTASAFTTTPGEAGGNQALVDQDLRKAASAGPNFAGHFAIVSWSCGMRCEGFAVVEVKTGRIYHPGFQVDGCEAGSKDPELLSFRLDSRLLILTGRREDYSKRNDPCGTFYYVVDEEQPKSGGHKRPRHADGTFGLRQIANRGR